jgi:cell division protein ZapA (FtsZ GTPase activity inhibitor)
MDEAKRFDIQLYGESYSIISDESEDKVFEVAKQVDDLMNLIARRTGLSDVKKIAVLTALKLATNKNELENAAIGYDDTCKKLVDMVNQRL